MPAINFEFPAPLPEVDWTNPLTAGLVNAFTFDGNVYDAVRQTPITPTVEYGSVSYVSSGDGLGLYTNNGSAISLPLTDDWSGPSTLVINCRINSIDNPWGGLYFKMGSATYQSGLQRSSSTNSLVYAANNSGATAVSGSSITSMLGTMSTIVVTHASASASSRWDCYINGQSIFGSTYTVAQATGSGKLILGAEPALNPIYDSDVVWQSFLRFNRVMSAGEIAQIGRNPNQLLRRQSMQIWVPSAAAGVPTLTSIAVSSITPTGAVLTIN